MAEDAALIISNGDTQQWQVSGDPDHAVSIGGATQDYPDTTPDFIYTTIQGLVEEYKLSAGIGAGISGSMHLVVIPIWRSGNVNDIEPACRFELFVDSVQWGE